MVDWPDTNTLRRWYWEEELSHSDIAERLDCSQSSVSLKFKRDGIPSRSTSKAWPDPETLRRWHWDEQMSTIEMAERIGRSSSGIIYQMKNHGIPRRQDGYIEVDWPQDSVLSEWYLEDHLSIWAIADRVGCSGKSVSNRLRKIGVSLRDPDNTAVTLSITKRRFLRYTRWAVGDTLRQFSRRMAIPYTTYTSWELGRSNISPHHRETWTSLSELGKQHGISPDRPRRQMYWSVFLDVLGDLLYELSCPQYLLADRLGVANNTLSTWRLEQARPYVGNHKAVRDLAHKHGVWSPPSPITDDVALPEGPEPLIELSPQDHEIIVALHLDGTHPTDLSMMYDVSLSTISKILQQATSS